MSGEEHDELMPASEDTAVQTFLDAHWRAATRDAREAMENVRKMWPELVEHMPEAATRQLQRALDDLSNGYEKLHKAGPHVIGQDNYDEYLEAQTDRALGS